MIATFWPDDQRQRYESAARRFRLPYWDWAVTPPSGESVLPQSIGGSPWIDVNGPNGFQRIANPLFSYNFKPLDRTAFSSGPVSGFQIASKLTTNNLYAVEYLDPNTQKPVKRWRRRPVQ
jgi:hypothetical protein